MNTQNGLLTQKRSLAMLFVLNLVAALSLSGALRADDPDGRPCNEEGKCKCEFEGTAGGFCGSLGYGSACTSGGATCGAIE